MRCCVRGSVFVLVLSSLLGCGEVLAPHAPIDPEGLGQSDDESQEPPMTELQTEPPLEVPGVVVPAQGRVYFVSPRADSVLRGPLVDGKVSVHITMGLEGAAVLPAGPLVAGTGHHHLLVDTREVPLGSAIPFDDTHMHYGKAQIEADVALRPGPHTLSLQLADGLHRSYGPGFAASIQIVVQYDVLDAGVAMPDAAVTDASLPIGIVQGMDGGL